MRKLILIVTVAAFAGPVALHAWAGSSEIDCINVRATAADIHAAWLVRRERRTPTAAEADAQVRVSQAAQACAAQHGWSEPRRAAASYYANSRVVYEYAVRDLAARGLAPGFIERVAADIGERGRAAVLAGDNEHGNLEYITGIVDRDLARVHLVLRPGSPESTEVGLTLGRGVAAKIGRDQARREFRAP